MNTNTTNNPYDDAELARALQEEYEREYRRRSMQQHLSLSGDSGTGTPRNANRDSNRNSNTNSNTNTRSINTARRSPTNAFARPPRSTQLTPTAPIASPSSSSPSHQQQQQQQTDVFEDPFYAPNYTLSAASFSSTPPSQHQQQHHQEQGPFYVLSGDSFGSVEVSDAAYARQLEQEMRLQQEQEDKEEAEAERTRRQARKQHLQDQRDSFRATRSSSFGRSSSGNSNLNANANANATHNNNITRPNLSHAQSYSTTYTSHSEASSMRPPERPTLQETSTATGTNTGSNSSSSSGPHQQQQSRSTRNIHNNSNYNNTNNHNSSQYASSSGYAHRDRDFPEQPIPQNNNAFTTTSSTSADEEYAWRLEQEMRDEEFARQAFVEDQIRQSSIAAQAIRGRNVTSSSRGQQQQRSPALSRRRKLCSCCATLLLSVALTALLFYFFVGKDTLNMSPDEFRAEDPFNNANKEDANLWDTPKGDMGLELSIINALDSNWHDSFYLAVDQWDAGTPDALTLDTEVWEPESVCKPETGKLKVCNGDYGETNWRGINKVMLENGLIYSSAARMNDYYSDDKNLAQKQYTMCHEVSSAVQCSVCVLVFRVQCSAVQCICDRPSV